jgi:hypothetical protein
MLWVVINPTADGSPDTVFPTVILGFYSYVLLSLSSEVCKPCADSKLPLAINCTSSATKAGPLSDPIDTGIPNQGMIFFHRHLATSQASSVQVGKASTYPEKVQTNIL